MAAAVSYTEGAMADPPENPDTPAPTPDDADTLSNGDLEPTHALEPVTSSRIGTKIGAFNTQAHGGKIQTIEQTGKKLKLQELLSFFLVVAGILLTMLHVETGATLAIVGVIWFLIIRFYVWWHHG
jgi:hypothetical protein